MGFELCHVNKLPILKIAPGGHLGRFVIWTESAFKELDRIYGDFDCKTKHSLKFK